jgi:hypothetical protein
MWTVERIWICTWKIIYNFQYRLTGIMTVYSTILCFWCTFLCMFHSNLLLPSSRTYPYLLNLSPLQFTFLHSSLILHPSPLSPLYHTSAIFLYPSPWTRLSCLSTWNPCLVQCSLFCSNFNNVAGLKVGVTEQFCLQDGCQRKRHTPERYFRDSVT